MPSFKTLWENFPDHDQVKARCEFSKTVVWKNRRDFLQGLLASRGREFCRPAALVGWSSQLFTDTALGG